MTVTLSRQPLFIICVGIDVAFAGLKGLVQGRIDHDT